MKIPECDLSPQLIPKHQRFQDESVYNNSLESESVYNNSLEPESVYNNSLESESVYNNSLEPESEPPPTSSLPSIPSTPPLQYIIKSHFKQESINNTYQFQESVLKYPFLRDLLESKECVRPQIKKEFVSPQRIVQSAQPSSLYPTPVPSPGTPVSVPSQDTNFVINKKEFVNNLLEKSFGHYQSFKSHKSHVKSKPSKSTKYSVKIKCHKKIIYQSDMSRTRNSSKLVENETSYREEFVEMSFDTQFGCTITECKKHLEEEKRKNLLSLINDLKFSKSSLSCDKEVFYSFFEKSMNGFKGVMKIQPFGKKSPRIIGQCWIAILLIVHGEISLCIENGKTKRLISGQEIKITSDRLFSIKNLKADEVYIYFNINFRPDFKINF